MGKEEQRKQRLYGMWRDVGLCGMYGVCLKLLKRGLAGSLKPKPQMMGYQKLLSGS